MVPPLLNAMHMLQAFGIVFAVVGLHVWVGEKSGIKKEGREGCLCLKGGLHFSNTCNSPIKVSLGDGVGVRKDA